MQTDMRSSEEEAETFLHNCIPRPLGLNKRNTYAAARGVTRVNIGAKSTAPYTDERKDEWMN